MLSREKSFPPAGCQKHLKFSLWNTLECSWVWKCHGRVIRKAQQNLVAAPPAPCGGRVFPEWSCFINNGELKQEKWSFPVLWCVKGNCSELCEGKQSRRERGSRVTKRSIISDGTGGNKDKGLPVLVSISMGAVALSALFVCWGTRQTWTIFGQSGLPWRDVIGGKKFKLRDGKSWSDTGSGKKKIEGGQALEGETVAFSILGDAQNLTEQHWFNGLCF